MLRVDGLTLRYPNGKLALADIDLAVAPGELLVVLGGNGSGKTTLLRCITRALKPTAGTVRLGHVDLAELSDEQLRRARLPLAMISQHAALVRRRSVLANVATGALGRHRGVWTALGGLPRAELSAAHGYLSEVGLAELAEQRAGTLSGGQAQRVAIARALAQCPQVLARGAIGFARAVPDLVWALLFVTAVGLGPFPGALALSVHSIGMLGRLFAETIEQMDMAPIDALVLTGARRVQIFSHGIVPSILPSLLGISLYRLDENILVVGAGLCRRRRHRLPAADGDEFVSIP